MRNITRLLALVVLACVALAGILLPRVRETAHAEAQAAAPANGVPLALYLPVISRIALSQAEWLSRRT